MPKRPNVVILIADQLGASALGACGHPVVRTPNIDTLVGRGADLDDSRRTMDWFHDMKNLSNAGIAVSELMSEGAVARCELLREGMYKLTFVDHDPTNDPAHAAVLRP